MKRLIGLPAITFLLFLVFVANTLAGSVDDYIKDLKNADPDVRAKAAFELGCS